MQHTYWGAASVIHVDCTVIAMCAKHAVVNTCITYTLIYAMLLHVNVQITHNSHAYL